MVNRMGKHKRCFSLSVIIPIHRADLDIRRCLLSLLNNLCLNLQIIVAANSDRRSELRRINHLIPDLPCIVLLNIDKAGKANAINEALNYVENEYVLIGDADTIFISKGIYRCVEKIHADKTIVAITGIVDPIEENKLASIQKFEYRRIFRIFRPLWNLFNANLIVPGCAGIFKTESLRSIGTYDCHTLGEDFEITLRLHDYHIRHKIPYKIEYVDTLVAKTDVPKTFKALIKQRGRWFAGQVEVIWKYRRILLNPKRYRKIILPYVIMILFEVLETYLKWMFFGIGAWIAFIADLSFWKLLLLSGLGFATFEILFNLCAGKKLKVRRTALILVLTCVLIVMQFILKDTNLITAIKLKKENKWE